MFSFIFVIFLINSLNSVNSENTVSTKEIEIEKDVDYWQSVAKTELFDSFHRDFTFKSPKNVIVFVGGGMGITTIAASRILKGQLKKQPGEGTKLSFEKFPNTCFLKSYSVDSQVADSSSPATAILSGVKTNNGVTGVTGRVKKGQADCETVFNNTVITIFDKAFMAGMSTGIITTSRLTQATVAGSYASIADSDWEGSIPSNMATHPSAECKDIARQLVENFPGKHFNVILGGGGRFFYPKNYTDSISGKSGRRDDGRNLVNQWSDFRKESGLKPEEYLFIGNRKEVLNTQNKPNVKYLFGIFNDNTMSYDMERNAELEPSLEEMVETAIGVLERNSRGFVLLVEGGLIDVAHHGNLANLAMHETLALDKAVEKAMMLTSIKETLVIVTADHSQALTLNGYANRGNDIKGDAGKDDETRKIFNTLIYSNGPGYVRNYMGSMKSDDIKYKSLSGVFLLSSAHTGEDVALYASGPMSHLFHSTKEQTYVSHAIQFALCIGPYTHFDHCDKSSYNSGQKPFVLPYLVIILLLLLSI